MQPAQPVVFGVHLFFRRIQYPLAPQDHSQSPGQPPPPPPPPPTGMMPQAPSKNLQLFSTLGHSAPAAIISARVGHRHVPGGDGGDPGSFNSVQLSKSCHPLTGSQYAPQPPEQRLKPPVPGPVFPNPKGLQVVVVVELVEVVVPPVVVVVELVVVVVVVWPQSGVVAVVLLDMQFVNVTSQSSVPQ